MLHLEFLFIAEVNCFVTFTIRKIRNPHNYSLKQFILSKNTLAKLLNIFIILHHEEYLPLNQHSFPELTKSDSILPHLQTNAKPVWYPLLLLILHCFTKVAPFLIFFGKLLALMFLGLLPDRLILQE